MMQDTLARRLFLILLIGAAMSAAAALWVSDASYRQRQADEGRADAATRLASEIQNIEAGRTPPGLNRVPVRTPHGAVDNAFTDQLNQTLGSTRAQAYSASRLACAPRPPAPASGPKPPLRDTAKDEGRRADPPFAGPVGGHCRLVVLQTLEGPLAMTLALPPSPASLTAGRFGLVFLGVLGLAAALLAWITARLAVQPLRRLSVAASALGDDLDRPPLAVRGPHEVREAAAAFNTMQARLREAMADRTRMLAAITHDLQTPLTRMRLRLDKVADADLRDRLLADFAATQLLIREGLDLARDTESGEPWGQVDLPSLIEALVEDMADAGLPVRLVDNARAVVRSRPQALRRALGNLIDNAIKHGGSAEVGSSSRPDGGVIITIRDHGPGIPEDALAQVLEPFHRLEQSRSRDSGGAGLGLTIAVRMAARSGAALTLRNHPQGGLEARVSFAQPSPV